MNNDTNFLQLAMDVFSVLNFTASYYWDFFIQQSTVTSPTDETWETYVLFLLSRIVYIWASDIELGNFFHQVCLDSMMYFYLTLECLLPQYLANFSYSLQTQLLSLLITDYDYVLLAKKQATTLCISPWVVEILLNILFYGFYFVLFFNLIFFTKSNISGIVSHHHTTYSKFSTLVESEEELGSLDDALFFVSIFIVLFSWFFLTSSLFAVLNVTSFSFLAITFLLLTFFVLSIPFSVLLDFGLCFASYVRGAGNSSNIFVEVLFDLIGVLVVFTRFIVQNIRFVLILWAYFELYEWFYLSPFTNLLNTLLDVHPQTFFSNFLNTQPSLFNLIKILFGLITYVYYFLHLLILLFIQLGAYFLISFWLFFFFYTSFYLTKSEKLFFFKRYASFN